MNISLNFSLIGPPSQKLPELLGEFQNRHTIKVNLLSMSWENAWPNLLTQALYGKGAGVSHIGSTWGSSLLAMNALREFKPQEIEALRTAFLQGQAHKPIRLWSRIEFQLGRAFDDITANILNKAEISVETILNTHLLQLQEHLELILA